MYGSRTKPGACLGCVVAGDLHQTDLQLVRSPALRSADPTARDGRVGYDEGEGADVTPQHFPVLWTWVGPCAACAVLPSQTASAGQVEALIGRWRAPVNWLEASGDVRPPAA